MMPMTEKNEVNVRSDDNDQGFAAIYKTLKIQPVRCDFLIQTSGSVRGNFIPRLDWHSLKINEGYCKGNDKRARFILLPCLELQEHWNYVQIPRTIEIRMTWKPGLTKSTIMVFGVAQVTGFFEENDQMSLSHCSCLHL